MKPIRVDISWKTIAFTLLSLIFLLVLYQLRGILVIIYIAFLLMVAVRPLIRLGDKYHVPPFPIMLLVYLIIITLMSMIVASLLPAIVEQSRALMDNTPFYLAELEEQFSFKFDSSLRSNYFSRIPSDILHLAVSAFSNVINVLAVFFIAYHLTVERPQLHLYLVHFFGHDRREAKAEKLMLAIEQRVGGWVRGQLFLMLLVGLITYIVVLLLGIPYALPLAALAAIFEAVPNIGPIVAAIPMVILGFTLSPLIGLGAIIASTLIQQLESIFIVPQVMKSTTGTKPLITIIVLMAGYTLGGVAGAVLAMPLFLTITTIYQHVLTNPK